MLLDSTVRKHTVHVDGRVAEHVPELTPELLVFTEIVFIFILRLHLLLVRLGTLLLRSLLYTHGGVRISDRTDTEIGASKKCSSGTCAYY